MEKLVEFILNTISKSSRKILGLVFFLSGILKVMDPVGTGLIMKDYASYLGLESLSSFIALLNIGIIELVLAVFLTLGIFTKITKYVTSFIILAFTILTAVLFVQNPEMDCGCFGEAIKLTHFQSFIKNIILMVFVVGLYFEPKSYRPSRLKYIVSAISLISLILFTVYSYMNIPMVDFTAFDKSSVLMAAVDNQEPRDMYISTFVYEKNGQKGIFTEDRLPDSTWTFVDTKVIKKQSITADYDNYPVLSFKDKYGNYYDSIAVDKNVMIYSLYDSNVSKSKISKIAQALRDAERAGMKPIFLINSSPEELETLLSDEDETTSLFVSSLTYFADYKTLISLNRSNGGATYFINGSLIDKWSYRQLPAYDSMTYMVSAEKNNILISANPKKTMLFEAFVLYMLVLLFLF